MASKLTLTTLDFSDETSTTSYEGVDLTAGNFAAQNALMDTLVGAQQDLQVGLITQDARLASVAQISGVIGSPYAQRELKFLVSFEDTVLGERHSIEIPAPALTFLVPGSDLVDLTDATVIAYIAALEAFYRVNGANTVDVKTIRLVGRNL
jgi:hypothetical protein